MTGPFGEVLTSTNFNADQNNAIQSASYQYLGQHQKLTESSLSINPIQMGARIYIGLMGRFIQVDPVEGGTLNSYIYVLDPINYTDLSGKDMWSDIGSFAGSAVNNTSSFIVNNWQSIAIGAAIGMGCAATAGIGCAIAVGATAGATAAGVTYTYENRNGGGSVDGAVGSIIGGGIGGAASGVVGFGVGAVLGKVVSVTPGLRTSSKLLGNSQMGAPKPGILNGLNTKNVKFGWSHDIDRRVVLRLGLGQKTVTSPSGRDFTISILHINIFKLWW